MWLECEMSQEALVFEHFVPSWWHRYERLWNLWKVDGVLWKEVS